MRFKLLLTVLSVLLIVGNSFAQQRVPKVLIVSLDGMNSDVWDAAYTPNIDHMISNATYTYNGLTLGPAFNSTTSSSILTGVWPDKHMVDSAYQNSDFATYPPFFDYLEMDGIKTAIFSREPKLISEIPSSSQHAVSFGTDDEVVSEASAYITDNVDFGAFFVQIDAALNIGMVQGFDPRRADYLKAIQKYDEQIGTVLSAVAARSSYLDENWMIIVTTNHGGQPNGTIGGDTRLETTPFIIFSGDNVRNRQFLLDILTAEKGKDNAVFLRPGFSEYIKIPKNGTKLADMGDFTIELRLKPKDATSDPSIISDKDWDSGGNAGYVFARRGSSWKFNIANTDRSRRDVNAGFNIEDDLWHHIAVTFDMDGDAICYTDGREGGRGFMGYPSGDSFLSPQEFIALGEDGTLNYTYGQWKGVFDEVRIFDTVVDSLTIAEWSGEKNVENRHPYKENLIGYWKLDEYEGVKVIDDSGNGYDGQTEGTKRVPANGAITHVDIAPTLMQHMGVTINEDWGLDGSVVDLIIPDIVLGVNKLRFETKDVTVFPNPTSDVLNFQFTNEVSHADKVTISVFDMSGNKIEQRTLRPGLTNISLDISSHRKGYYLYHIQGTTFSYKGKFIINN